MFLWIWLKRDLDGSEIRENDIFSVKNEWENVRKKNGEKSVLCSIENRPIYRESEAADLSRGAGRAWGRTPCVPTQVSKSNFFPIF